MEFGQIIKKAWTITWRYRFLWVMGLFAGVTGAGSGGGGYSGGQSFGSGGSGSGGGSGSSPFSATQMRQLGATAQQWAPAIAAALVIWLLFALFLWALSLAARGGLVWAVNELEEGRTPSLGSSWSAGLSHFWPVLGLGLLLGLPMLLVVVMLIAAIGVPLIIAFSHGGGNAAAAIVPVCGSLIIGLPLVIVLAIILGIMYVVALRRIVLDGVGVVAAAGDAWRTFRSRFKETATMWLINWGLNVAAGLALAIPIVILTVVLVVPAVLAGIGQSWGVLAVLVGVWILVVMAIAIMFRAIWGTFTSALWTILYRRLTGREQIVHPTRYAYPPQPGPTGAPGYPPAPAPVAPGYPPAPAAPGAYPPPSAWAPASPAPGWPAGPTQPPSAPQVGEPQ